MTKIKTGLTLVILLTALLNAYSQGCSDAGFCTMGAMKPDQPFNKKIEFKLRSMEVSFYRGKTTLTPVVYVATADMNFSLSRKTSFQLKVPYQAVRGRLGKTQGAGDISLCITRNLVNNEKYDINFSFGAKIPTNHSDKVNDEGKHLPMYYQTSLGTYDGIVGISLVSRRWLFATGVQHPFNRNNNEFWRSEWIESDVGENNYKNKYPNSFHLKRGTDVMVRVERNFRFSRLNLSIGLLPIYRVNHDQVTNPITGEVIKPTGAMGLAMSAIATVGYSFNVKSGVKILVGKKLVQRSENPDGLTRHNVVTLSYVYRF